MTPSPALLIASAMRAWPTALRLRGGETTRSPSQGKVASAAHSVMHRWAEGDGDPLTRFAWADEFEPSRGKNELFSHRRHESKLLVISAVDCAEGEPAVTRTHMLYLVI